MLVDFSTGHAHTQDHDATDSTDPSAAPRSRPELRPDQRRAGIRQEHSGFKHKCPGQQHAAFHSRGQRSEVFVDRQLHFLQQGFDRASVIGEVIDGLPQVVVG